MAIPAIALICTGVQESRPATDTVPAQYQITLKPKTPTPSFSLKVSPLILTTEDPTVADDFTIGHEYTLPISEVTP